MKVGQPSRGNAKVEVTGLRLQDLTPAMAQDLKGLIYEHKIVVVRDQQMTNPEYIAAAKLLGTPQVYLQDNYHHPDHPEIFVSSNVLHDGKRIGVPGTGRYWHTDYQFMPEPLPLVVIYPQVLPPNGKETHYCLMDDAYDRLPADLRRYADKAVGRHEGKWQYKIQAKDVDRSIREILAECDTIAPTVTHPVVFEHVVTKRKCLYVSRGFTVGIVGESTESGNEILGRLFEVIEDERYVVTHNYMIGDVILWDNRQLLHKAGKGTPGEVSESYRIGVYDGLDFYRAPAQG